MRIFIGLTEIAGYYNNLWRGFEELDVQAVFVDLAGHPFKYRRGGTRNRLVRLVEHAGARRTATPKSKLLLKAWWVGLLVILKPALFVWALARYDVFIFGYTSTFWGFRELPVLKLLGKRVVYVFHGSDSRPTYIDGSEMASDRGASIETCIRSTRRKKAALRKIERYADIVVSHPPSSQLHEKPLISFVAVGIPFDFGTDEPEDRLQASPAPGSHSPPAVVRVVHSPSHPEAKGTPAIRAAIESLRARGHSIEYVEISGKPNAVVLEELARCDFVVDQVYSDTPMSGFAAEAAWFRRPAVVGGYAEEAILGSAPPDMLPPTLYCHPDRLQEAIERLVVDEEYRAQLGDRARRFVEANWTCRQVAARYLQVLGGWVPEGCIYDPCQIRYLEGAGLSAASARQIVRAVLEEGGREALQLAGKPELEKLFVEFGGSSDSRC